MTLHLSRRARSRVAAASGLLLSLGVVTVVAPAPIAAAADEETPAATESVVPLTPDAVIDAAQPSTLLAKTTPSLLRLTDSDPVPVMIKYDYDAVASYTGTIKGLAATSPSETGDDLTTSSLQGTSAVGDYADFVAAREAEISARVRKAVPDADITGSFQLVYGGVSAQVPGDAVADLLDVPGVVAVQKDAVNHPTEDASTVAIAPDAAYRALGSSPDDAGTGVLFGSLDSGIWPEHPSLVDDGTLPTYDGAPLPCEFGDNPQTSAVDSFVCNNKVVGGEAFLDTYTSLRGSSYPNPGTARDGDGHGTHTTTTAAGDVVDNAPVYGRSVRLFGVAPGAQVMSYRVCALTTCYGSDSADAVQQAILDGVDVLNFSITGGVNPATDPVELAFLDAYNAGIFVATSAGNTGPGTSTTQHASPWVSTVAATTWGTLPTSLLTLTAGNGDTLTVDGVSGTQGAGPLPLALSTVSSYNRPLCDAPAAPGTFTGTIVVCQRGVNPRVEKGYNVLQGGAAGMILANQSGMTDTAPDPHWLPSVQIANGPAMMSFITGHTGITAEFTGPERRKMAPAVASFSSRGPVGGFIKPDIAAPGVAVLAGVAPTVASPSGGPGGEYYQNYNGTSMAAPHVAGAAILLRALHPDWTPGQIRSVLTTTALQGTTKHDSAALATPFDVGNGRLNVGRAATVTPLAISDTGANLAALSDDAERRVDLNLPSINAPSVLGGMTTERTVENLSSAPVTVTTRKRVKPGTTISVSPATTTIDPGGSATFTITLTSTAPVDQQQFATVGFATGQDVLRIPVAYVRKPSKVSLQQHCDDPSIAVAARTTCHVTASNESTDEVQVDLTSNQLFQTAVVSGAQGATRKGNRATTTKTLAARVFSTPSLESIPSPFGGFSDLTGAVPPQAIGDDAVATYTVPPVSYGGSTYTTLGVVSNGYLVMGGATAADVVVVPPTAPSAARPNNVVAPFWTDLDGTGTPGIRVASVVRSGIEYVVVQWDVKVYGTNDARTFQVWLRVGAVQDVFFEYPAPPTAPATPYAIGAENEVGAGVLTTDLPTQSLRVRSSPSTEDSVSYDVTVLGRSVGSAGIFRTLADVLHGGRLASRTVASTPIEVTASQ